VQQMLDFIDGSSGRCCADPHDGPRAVAAAHRARRRRGWSGDLLGAARLIRALRARYPDAEFAGVGGPAMRAAGRRRLARLQRAGGDGPGRSAAAPAAPAAAAPAAARAPAGVAKPDVFIGIDAPDFNLGLERRLKARGIPPCTTSAPRCGRGAWRAAKIGRSADRVLCLFPMEPPIYAGHGVDARFVGHPLADACRCRARPRRRAPTLGIAAEAQVLALLPGSRLGEIGRIGRAPAGARVHAG
jgi:lipid-A-disaccharide synthase